MSSDDYAIDDGGNCVLIGLSADETEEFLRLERMIEDKVIPVSSKEWKSADELRWLELYEKHETAKQPFLTTKKTAH